VVSGHFIAKPYRKDELIARFSSIIEGELESSETQIREQKNA
jgi:hypothetical protein